MTSTAAAWFLTALIALPPAYILPGERILLVLAQRREKALPLRVEATLTGVDARWPRSVVFELHPDLGFRVSDDAGGRWLIRGGRVVAGSGAVPDWIPALEILILREEEDLQAWMRWAGVDYESSGLARCGDSDCFVIGGREVRRQLWVEKDGFDVLQWVAGPGSRIEFSEHRDWDRVRFPSEIRIVDREQEFALLTIDEVREDRTLIDGDFTRTWVVIPSSM